MNSIQKLYEWNKFKEEKQGKLTKISNEELISTVLCHLQHMSSPVGLAPGGEPGGRMHSDAVLCQLVLPELFNRLKDKTNEKSETTDD